MDDLFAKMDAEKRRRGSLAVLRALYPELFGEEPAPDETATEAGDITPAASDGAAATPDEVHGPQPERDSEESACLAGWRR